MRCPQTSLAGDCLPRRGSRRHQTWNTPCVTDQNVPVPQRTVAELLGDYARTLSQLRTRGVIRSANAPAGDFAEWLFQRALGGQIVDSRSVRSYNLTLPDGDRVQVKARAVSDPPSRGQLQTSPFRSWDFEFVGLLLLRDSDYTVLRAAMVPMEVVRASATLRTHVNGFVVQMTETLLGHAQAVDVTERLKAAASD